jgi:hypothetical protein
MAEAANAERLKNLSETAKNLITALAILVGGVWTLYTFRTLGEEQKSRSLLANIEATTANASAQRREAELKAQDFPLGLELVVRPRGRRRIYVSATLHNPGAGPLVLTFREPTFRLARIVRTAGGPSLTAVAEGRAVYLTAQGASPVPTRRLLGQQTRRVPYLFDVAEPGDYLVQANVHYRDESDAAEDTFAFEQEIVRVE